MSTDIILGLVLLILAIIASLLKKAYFELPLSELKKRRAVGEEVNDGIIKSLSYGAALRCLLWLALGLSLSASLSLFALSLPIWLSIIIGSIILYFIFSYLPSTKVGGISRTLANLASPGLNWLLQRTNRYLNSIYAPFARRYAVPANTIFDSQDLLNFLKTQSKRTDHRIEPEAFTVLERSLSFGNLRVSDLMTPAKKVKTMIETDVIGPILINELHESNDGYALVKNEPKGDVTGLLTISDLNLRSQGSVASHMRKDICFVNENDFAANVIKAFYDTKSQIFVVINESHKFVGTISLENVIKKLLGSLDSLAGASEGYADPEAVAKTDD